MCWLAGRLAGWLISSPVVLHNATLTQHPFMPSSLICLWRPAALHLACQHARMACVQVLMEGGASARVPDALGRTALELAQAAGHCDVVAMIQHHEEVQQLLLEQQRQQQQAVGEAAAALVIEHGREAERQQQEEEGLG